MLKKSCHIARFHTLEKLHQEIPDRKRFMSIEFLMAGQPGPGGRIINTTRGETSYHVMKILKKDGKKNKDS